MKKEEINRPGKMLIVNARNNATNSEIYVFKKIIIEPKKSWIK
jgi:hypothetical protein